MNLRDYIFQQNSANYEKICAEKKICGTNKNPVVEQPVVLLQIPSKEDIYQDGYDDGYLAAKIIFDD